MRRPAASPRTVLLLLAAALASLDVRTASPLPAVTDPLTLDGAAARAGARGKVDRATRRLVLRPRARRR